MIKRDSILSVLTLFGSASTLVCCALPALLVSLGAGAVMIGLVSAVPQLVWLSEHKVALFLIAGLLLAGSSLSTYMARNAPCPIDPNQAKACMRLRRNSKIILIVSWVLYVIGFFFAFIIIFLA